MQSTFNNSNNSMFIDEGNRPQLMNESMRITENNIINMNKDLTDPYDSTGFEN